MKKLRRVTTTGVVWFTDPPWPFSGYVVLMWRPVLQENGYWGRQYVEHTWVF